jgi:hypothetical protein
VNPLLLFPASGEVGTQRSLIQIVPKFVIIEVAMFDALTEKVRAMTAESGTKSNRGFMLWIDGVGAWMACLNSEITIGGPTFDAQPADISLLANISRIHATVRRSGDSWSLEAHSNTQVGDRNVEEKTTLRRDTQIKLGNTVELGFRIPTALSTTAVLDFVSEHRPSQSVDGIVLVNDNCLLGPGKENHIVCPGWPDTLVLFRRDGKWHCKSRMNLAVNGDIVTDSHEVKAGSMITGDEIRLRIESL